MISFILFMVIITLIYIWFSMNNKSKNIKSKTWWNNGQIKTSVIYIDGKKQGDYLKYNKDGILIKTCKYINGKKNGLYKTYYEDGHLKKICYYINGKKNIIKKL